MSKLTDDLQHAIDRLELEAEDFERTAANYKRQGMNAPGSAALAARNRDVCITLRCIQDFAENAANAA